MENLPIEIATHLYLTKFGGWTRELKDNEVGLNVNCLKQTKLFPYDFVIDSRARSLICQSAPIQIASSSPSKCLSTVTIFAFSFLPIARIILSAKSGVDIFFFYSLQQFEVTPRVMQTPRQLMPS